MTTKTNYRAALEAMKIIHGIKNTIDGRFYTTDCCTNEPKQFYMDHHETIRRALLIAERLEREPSEEVILSMYHQKAIGASSREIFKAMRDQLLAEVDAEMAGAE